MDKLKRVIVLILTLAMCFQFAVPALAADDTDVTYSATFDPAVVYTSSEAQTVALTIKPSKAIAIDGLTGQAFIPNGFKLNSITNSDLNIPAGQVNTSNGRFTWSSSVYNEELDNMNVATQSIVVATYTIPANLPAGDYEFEFVIEEMTSDWWSIFWEPANITATLEIKDAAPTVFDLYVEGEKLADGLSEGDDLTAILASAEAKDGYTFKGWNFYKDADKTQTVTLTDNKMPAHDLYVYGTWEEIPTYTLTFQDENGGTLATYTYKNGWNATPAYPNYTKEHHTISWDKQIPSTLTADMVIKAVAAPKTYKLTFLDENGDVLSSTSYEYGKNVTATYPAYTKANYTITWNKEIPATLTCDLEISAIVKPNVYTITFYDGESDAGEAEANVVNGWKATIMDDLAGDGKHKVFKGWSETKDGTAVDKYTAGAQIALTKDLNLYAVWETTPCADGDDDDHVCDTCQGVVEGETCTPGAAATCTTAQTCTECGEVLTPALGHKFEDIAAKDATCLAAGNIAHKKCETCDLYFDVAAEKNATDGKATDTEFVDPQKSHSYTGAVKMVSNGKDGTHYFLCVRGCNEYGGAVAHTWNDGEQTKAPDCLGEGTKTYTCTDNCGATYTETLNAKGHTFSEPVAKQDATCMAAGHEAYKQCTVCELYFAANAAVNAADGKADTTSFTIPVNEDAHAYSNEISGYTINNNDGTHTAYYNCTLNAEHAKKTGATATHTYDTETHVCVCEKVEEFTIKFYEDSNDSSYLGSITAPYGTDIRDQVAEMVAKYEEAVPYVTFSHWYEKSDTFANKVDLPTMPGENMSVAGNGVRRTYNITWKVDGDTYATTGASYSNSFEVPANPTKTNYTFQHWVDAKGKKLEVQTLSNGKLWSTVSYDIVGDSEYTAVFTPNEYTVVINGISHTAKESNNWTLEIPADPTLTGHNFAGWATTENATEADTTYKAGDQVAFTESTALYPVFTIATYTLTFELGNGTIDDKNTYTITGEYGGDVTLPAITAPEGYKLTGWTVNGASAQKPDTIPATDRTYTANWELIDVTVKFNEGDTKELTGQYFGTVTAPTLTKEGYTFLGWAETAAENAEVKFRAGENITLNSNTPATLYAKWEVIYYTLTFDYNGGKDNDGFASYPAGAKYKDTISADGMLVWSACTREGYTLTGWNYKADGTGESFDMTKDFTMPAKDVTIYAQWKLNEYTITWDVEGVKTETTVKHGETPTHATPTKAETAQYTYTFDGWKDVSGNAPAAATGDTTYTAQFTPVLRSYDITFVVDGEETKVSTKYGEKPVIANPTKASDTQYSYTFAGWQDAEGNKVDTLPDVTGPATYTATWTKTDRIYTVTFLVDDEIYWQAQGKYGDSIKYDGFYEPAQYGYNFSGWSEEEPETFTKNMTITGELIIGKYTIIFMDDDKETKLGEITAEFGTDISEQIAEFTSHKTGYELDQWVSEDGNTVYSTMDKMWGQNLTVYATWQKCYYMFNFYNGSVAAENYLDFYWFSYEEKYDTMDAFVAKTNLSQRIPKGYKIVGLTYEDGTEMEFPYIQGVSGADVIVKLEAIPYTVTFMDGETKVGEITAPYGSDITKQVAAITATKEGYKFNCWMTEDNKCANLSQMPLNGMTVTADFTINEYNINFYATEG